MKQLSLWCAVLLSFAVFSQPNSTIDIKEGSISGRAMDATLKEPLPYVNVIIKDANDKIIAGSITNEDGTFNIDKIPQGTVTVEIKFICYKTITKQVTLGKEKYKINTGYISLEEDVENLNEVTVVAEVSTIQQKVDRTFITIGKDLTTSGPTASDIMNNLPSVSVDQKTGDVALCVNENVQVMVDGKLTNIAPAQLLKQIPSTSIKQTELIINPSAKCNPQPRS